MRAALLWAAYTGAILGVVVESADEKFSALAESEQSAWGAALVAQSVPAVTPAVPLPEKLELPKPL